MISEKNKRQKEEATLELAGPSVECAACSKREPPPCLGCLCGLSCPCPPCLAASQAKFHSTRCKTDRAGWPCGCRFLQLRVIAGAGRKRWAFLGSGFCRMVQHHQAPPPPSTSREGLSSLSFTIHNSLSNYLRSTDQCPRYLSSVCECILHRLIEMRLFPEGRLDGN